MQTRVFTRKPSFYYEYLRSLQWKQIRLDYLKRIGWACERCYINKVRIVHHLSYDRLGHEPPEDLMGLCANCHAAMHTWPTKLIAANDNQLKLPLEETG